MRFTPVQYIIFPQGEKVRSMFNNLDCVCPIFDSANVLWWNCQVPLNRPNPGHYRPSERIARYEMLMRGVDPPHPMSGRLR